MSRIRWSFHVLILLAISVTSTPNAMAGGSPATSVPNYEEIAVYFEALRAIRDGHIEGVVLGGPVLLARWTTLEPNYLRISGGGVPEEYRGAISDYRRLCDDLRLDLSTIDIDDVTFSEDLRFEPGLCTISFSLIGFGESMLTAATRVRVRCETDPPSASDLLICLTRTEWGWIATDFARLINSNLRFRSWASH